MNSSRLRATAFDCDPRPPGSALPWSPLLALGLAAPAAGLVVRRGRFAPAAALGLFVWWNVSLMAQFGLKLMDRQELAGRTLWLSLTAREQLVRETR